MIKVEEMRVSELVPYENNPRKNEEAVDAVAASIEEFGFKCPIVVDGRHEIVAGHTRLKAAKKIGLKTVPVIVADDLTDDQIKAFRLADNKTAELAEWDTDKLLAEIAAIDIDLEPFGFEPLEVQAEDIQEDYYTPAISDVPISRPSQIWQLGDHRVMCGDSTSADDVARLMNGEIADLVITDPPYNVDYEGQNKNLRHKKIENDKMSDSAFYNFLFDFYTQMVVLSP